MLQFLLKSRPVYHDLPSLEVILKDISGHIPIMIQSINLKGTKMQRHSYFDCMRSLTSLEREKKVRR